MGNKIENSIAVFILIVVILVVVFIVNTVINKIKCKNIERKIAAEIVKLPVLTSQARVAAKREIASSTKNKNSANVFKEYFVVFALENGAKVEFIVDKKIYDILQKNDEGSLTYKEGRYFSGGVKLESFEGKKALV